MRSIPMGLSAIFMTGSLAMAQTPAPVQSTVTPQINELSLNVIGAVGTFAATVRELDTKTQRLTSERDQLKTDLDAMTKERDELKVSVAEAKKVTEMRSAPRPSKPRNTNVAPNQ